MSTYIEQSQGAEISSPSSCYVSRVHLSEESSYIKQTKEGSNSAKILSTSDAYSVSHAKIGKIRYVRK